MKPIIVGTNRPDSRSQTIAEIIHKLHSEIKSQTQIMSLKDLPLQSLDGSQYSENQPSELKTAIETLNKSEGIIIVCPEYNGSFPGILKYFIDHWEYPKTFQNRPVCFVGLGGQWGACRPVEQLQQVFNYRNAYQFPERVFIKNVWNELKDGELSESYMDMLRKQAQGFDTFCQVINKSGLLPS